MVALTPPNVKFTSAASVGKSVPVIVISVPTVPDSGDMAVTVNSTGPSSSSLQATKANSMNIKENNLKVVFIGIFVCGLKLKV